MEPLFVNARDALIKLIYDDDIPLNMRVMALKSLDMLTFGKLSDIRYDLNHIKWFIENGNEEYDAMSIFIDEEGV